MYPIASATTARKTEIQMSSIPQAYHLLMSAE
jgi:hypothetical protein